MSSSKYNATVIVTSDTCFTSPDKDESGHFVVSQLEETNLFQQVTKQIVPDVKGEIVRCINDTLHEHDPALLITIGGTGLTPRDVTPEATSSLYERQCSGITFGLHMIGQRYSSHAALSRLTSGIVGGTLVINFPGSKKACQDCMSWLKGILEHALEMIRNDLESYRQTHSKLRELDLGATAANITQGDDGSPASTDTDPISLFIKNHNLHEAFKKPNKSTLELIDGAPLIATTSMTKTSAIKSKAPVAKTVVHSKRPYHVNRRGPSSVISIASKMSTSSKLTIDAVMDSRCEFPVEELRAPSSIRSVNGPIVTNLPKTRIMPLECSFPMLGFAEAFEILEANAKQMLGEPVEVELKNHQKASSLIGAVLAQELQPRRIIPPYACSTVDGYVVNIPKSNKDTNRGEPIKTHTLARLVPSLRQFEIDQKDETKADKFFCCQINTGGRLPNHSYAVVPVERTKPIQCNVPTIQLQGILIHANVRRPGVDLGHSDVLKAGTVIGPVELAVILAMGHKSVQVYHKPRIGVLSTGDEIKDSFGPQPASDNDVVDTNGPLLTSMFQSRGYFAVNLGVAQDDPDRICAKLQDGLNKCDIVLVTGGASMGTKDHVKSVIAHLGGKIHFGRVNMKPGKPVAFASLGEGERTKYIFSLPGNPVSAFITAKMLALPFIHHGLRTHSRPDAKLSFDAVGDPINVEIVDLIDGKLYEFGDRLEFVRAKIVARRPAVEFKPVYAVKVSVKQQSSRMLSLVDCDCLIMIDPNLNGQKLTVGEMYPALKLHQRH